MKIELYHGTNALFDEFSNDNLCTKDSIDQYGSGFYFFGDKAQPIKHGELMVVADVEINKILEWKNTGKEELSYSEAEDLILSSPDLDSKLTNFGDVEYEGYDNVLYSAVRMYCNQDIIRSLNTIGNDFFRRKETHLLLKKFIKITGFDCIRDEERNIYVILSKNQITIKKTLVHSEME